MNSSGIIVVDKTRGITSHDIVAKARRVLGTRKVGHAGTLDPFATGVVILLVNEGTKLSNMIMDGRKVYRALIKLGEKRDTGDCTGEVIEQATFDHISQKSVEKVLENFVGIVKQVPPMYSAIKKNGVPLYKYARKGLEVERKEREIMIDKVTLIRYSEPYIDIEVSCSKGTYVRTLAEDISQALGSCGHLEELRRIRSSSFSVDEAVSMDDMEERGKLLNSMIPLNKALPELPGIVVREDAVKKVCNGRPLIPEWVLHVNGSKNKDRAGNVKVLAPDGALLSIMKTTENLDTLSSFLPGRSLGRSLRVFNN